MFSGINALNLDDKGRFAIPSRYRTALKDTVSGINQLVITIDTEDRCLLLYPVAEWQMIAAKIEALPSFNKAARRIQRLLIGHASEVDMDGSGRILVPPLLREYAELKKEIVLIGQGKKFEIWSKAVWQDNCDQWIATGGNDLANDLPPELLNLSL